jgi:hypothetical protein
MTKLSVTLTAAATIAAAVAVSGHDPIGTKVSWDREIAPLVQARCVSCHSPAGKAPMPLTTYEETRPWARAIREEVLTRRMPKWHVVRGYGDFTNDPSLSAFEIALITAWVDGGAPKSLPGKPPAAVPPRPVQPSPPVPPTRAVTADCDRRTALPGRLLGLRAELEEGQSVRVTASIAGAEEPLLWIRDFEPGFASTCWLRTPIDLDRSARVTVTGTAPCRVTFLLAARTAR